MNCASMDSVWCGWHFPAWKQHLHANILSRFNRTSMYFVSIHSPITMHQSACRIAITSGLKDEIGFESSSSAAACTVTISMLTSLCIVQHVWFANWPFPDCIEQSRSALVKELLTFIESANSASFSGTMCNVKLLLSEWSLRTLYWNLSCGSLFVESTSA